MSTRIVILAGARTPVGKLSGSLKLGLAGCGRSTRALGCGREMLLSKLDPRTVQIVRSRVGLDGGHKQIEPPSQRLGLHLLPFSHAGDSPSPQLVVG